VLYDITDNRAQRVRDGRQTRGASTPIIASPIFDAGALRELAVLATRM